MIAFLKGVVIEKGEDYFILDVEGVGYEVFTPTTTLEKLTLTQPLSLNIYTAVREDQISLFGFHSLREKKVFLLLISVSGIGPKLALNILSGISTEELIAAIYQGNLVRLTAISGVGKKTAERLIVELKDKLLKLCETPVLSEKQMQSSSATNDVLSALLNLGYNKNEIEKVLSRLQLNESTGFEASLKSALQALSKA